MISVEAEGFDNLAADLRALAPGVESGLPRIVRKAGVKIKSAWNEAASGSRHFRIAGTVSFDEKAVDGGYEVEVGPDRSRRAARLAGIAHFGGANGGGGTLGDPQRFLDDEAPNIEAAVAQLIDKVLS